MNHSFIIIMNASLGLCVCGMFFTPLSFGITFFKSYSYHIKNEDVQNVYIFNNNRCYV